VTYRLPRHAGRHDQLIMAHFREEFQLYVVMLSGVADKF
jgi:hypothetical protein